MSDSLLVNNGTAATPPVPYTVFESVHIFQNTQEEHFQAISAQEEHMNLSFEELRLADYKQGNVLPSGSADDNAATTSTQHSRRVPQTSCKSSSSYLELLTGPAIVVEVGIANSLTGDSISWSLPQRLVSHHSPFLKAACLKGCRERRENTIELPHEDTTVFALFVEWLYYGEYTAVPVPSQPSYPKPDRANIDADCWVLGDKLSCTEFKNHAMRRLYKRHAIPMFCTPISPHDVQFASKNTAETSKLRQLFVDLAATHIRKSCKVQGTVDEWDKLLAEQSDLRRLLLEGLLCGNTERNFVKSENYYLQDGDDDVP